MATANIAVTEGSGKNLATNSITEDSITKQVQRAVLNNSSGTEIGTASTPVRVDPTGTTTQPVSISGNQAVNVAQINGVTTTMGNGISGTGVQRVTIASDSTGQVTLAAGANTIGSLAANQSTNVAQINGVAPTMGNGVSGTGVQRVTIASDSTGQVTLATGANTIGALSANQTVNVAQINGVTTTMGNGVSGTGVQRVTIASDSTGQVTLAAGANTIGALSANQSVNVAQMNGVATTMGNGVSGTGVQRVAIASDNSAVSGLGAGATGSAVPANAVYKGGIAKTALPTAATDGNLTGVMIDKYGRQVTQPITIRDLTGTQTTTISASTTETTIVTAAASVFNDLVMLVVSNTSASTNTRIDFRDTTAGTVLFSLQSPGNTTVGFCPPVAIPQTTVNTNWTAQCATSTTDIRIYAVFAKNR